MKNATSSLFRNDNRSALEAGTYITHRVIYSPLVIIIIIKVLSHPHPAASRVQIPWDYIFIGQAFRPYLCPNVLFSGPWTRDTVKFVKVLLTYLKKWSPANCLTLKAVDA